MRFEKPNKSIETFVGALKLNEMNGQVEIVGPATMQEVARRCRK